MLFICLQYHTATGQVWAEMARNLADSLIIPFNVSDYAVTLDHLRKALFKDFESLMTQNGINTSNVYESKESLSLFYIRDQSDF